MWKCHKCGKPVYFGEYLSQFFILNIEDFFLLVLILYL